MTILYIGNKLSRHGFTPTSIETLGPKLEELGYTLKYASDRKNQLLRLFVMLITIWQNRAKIDLILIDTYSSMAFYYACLSGLLARLLQLPYCPILRGGDLPNRLTKTPKLARQLFTNSHANIAISPFLEKVFADFGHPTQLIPNSIDVDKYPFRLRIKIRPKILWVRAFHVTYNPILAVQILHCLIQNYPDAEMAMIGPDKDGSMSECRKIARYLGVESRIKFAGRLSKIEWSKIASGYDIFLNTTNFDNTPISVLEAMALGLPVVSSKVGGIPYFLSDGNTALLVSPGDLEAFVRCIERLLCEPPLVKHLSMNGKKVADNYDWGVVKKKWIKLLSKNLDDKSSL